MPPTQLSDNVALCFSWSYPIIVPHYLRLAEHLRSALGIECVFVTDTLEGSLLFLRAGFHAFSIAKLAELAEPHFPEEDLQRDFIEWARGVEKSDPRFSAEDLAQKETKAVSHWQAYSLALHCLRPKLVLSWNGANPLARILIGLARQSHIPCFFLERGLLPETLVVDPQGVNYGSDVAGADWANVVADMPEPEEVSVLEQYCKSLSARGISVVKQGENLAHNEVRERLGLPVNAKIVLLPLQIEWDSNILAYSPHFKTMPAVIQAVHAVIESHENVFLVIKPHPEDRCRLDELSSFCGNRARLSTEVALHSLLPIADVVVTINSTVGLEALTQGKPVVVLGKAIYGEKGFTYDLGSPEHLPLLLNEALRRPASDDGSLNLEFLRFLLFLLKHRLFPTGDADNWGSRQHIGDMVAASIRQAGDPYRPSGLGSELLLEWFQTNLVLMNPAGSEVGRILVAGFPSAALERLREEGLFDIFEAKTALFTLLRSLFQPYAHSFFIGEPLGILGLAWRFTRSRNRHIYR